ncbi:hypothetical protein TGGT1_212075 [Toxoplasma gondii GT1]|uniref:Meiosis-specific nuclear structural protein 1 n=2 Tax=Toxoplasma gondii TaxID=5811 RepID=S7UVN2_TOXGG|nr:hypothetical protein TGGT1_212075 [Toxoplasma gondii GT1]KAF4640357.1 hypothetical protein TGRH88_042830 [Toxoplasma gondii]
MHRLVQARIDRQRAVEVRENQLREHLKSISLVNMKTQSDRRVEALRREREKKEEMMTLELDAMFTMHDQDACRKKRLIELEEMTAAELQREQAERTRAETYKRRVCDESEELRHLKEKLQMAKVNRERAAQVIEHQIRAVEEEEIQAAIDAQVEAGRLHLLEEEKRLQLQHLEKERAAKDMQRQQIGERRESRKREAAEEYNRDKAQVQDLIRQLLEQEDQDNRRNAAKRAAERQQIQESLRQKELWRQQQIALSEHEDAKIREYAALQAARNEKLDQEREEREAEKRRVLLELSRQKLERDAREKEHQQLLDDLHLDEKEELERQKAEAESRRKQEDRKALLRAFDEQMAEKERRRQEALENEQVYRQKLLAQFAEQDRIEQMNEQKKRLRIQEHMRQVERLIIQRRQLFEAEREAEKQTWERLAAVEEEKQTVVEQERLRLLREHAELAKFLPKGTLKKPQELDLLHEAAAQKRRLCRTQFTLT